MHRLLKRQLKKTQITPEDLPANFHRFFNLVDQAYISADEDRSLLENTLTISSKEMQGLYDELAEKSAQKLNQSEAKYSRLLEKLEYHYFFYTINLQGQYTFVSDSVQRILGFPPEAFLGYVAEKQTSELLNQIALDKLKLSLSGIPQKPYKLSILDKQGETRYLEVTELPIFDNQNQVMGIEGIARDITEAHQAHQKITDIAQKCQLTGLINRYHLETLLNELIINPLTTNFAMCFLDLDHFKQVNDTLGHEVGDKLLQKVVKRIRPCLASDDLFARIGGDEFIIIIQNTETDALADKLQNIMLLMQAPWIIDRHELKLSTSVGVALYPQDAQSTQDLMKKSDLAMYQAKRQGRDNIHFFTEDLNQKALELMELEQDLGKALKNNQFELYLQPSIDVRTNNIVGAEALIRWHHPEKGLISPAKFIPIAEKTGLIISLGNWIIDQACQQIARINTASGEKASQLIYSINVSFRQFQRGDVLQTLEKAVKQYQIKPKQLAIEITESIFKDDVDALSMQLKQINNLGIQIYMDDFGTGYSSLANLHQLSIDCLKIDKAFVDEIAQGEASSKLLNTIISMGKSLNMRVIAEGIETPEQLGYIKQQDCDYYQGFYFTQALPESEFIALLTNYFS